MNTEVAKTELAQAAPTRAGSALDFLRAHLRDYAMLLSLVAIMAFFQYMTGGTLMQPLNLTNLILQNSYIVIMALGMLLVIVAGHIDLSVGSVVGFIGALAAVLMVDYNWNFIAASALCLVAGAVQAAARTSARRRWSRSATTTPGSSSATCASTACCCRCSRSWCSSR